MWKKYEWSNLSFKDVWNIIKKDCKSNKLIIEDEYNWADEKEFLLKYKGWYALCRMSFAYPYNIRHKIIWYRQYDSCKPNVFVDTLNSILKH